MCKNNENKAFQSSFRKLLTTCNSDGVSSGSAAGPQPACMQEADRTVRGAPRVG